LFRSAMIADLNNDYSFQMNLWTSGRNSHCSDQQSLQQLLKALGKSG